MNRDSTYYSSKSTTHSVLDFSIINNDFFTQNLKKWNWVSMLFKVSFSISLIALVYLIISIVNSDIDSVGLIFQLAIGALFSIVLLPIHEGLHALIYRVLGAQDISIDKNWKKFSFFVSAHRFVLTKGEYVFVILFPFSFISLSLLCCIFFFAEYIVMILTIILIHTSMAKGDFGLVSYITNLDKELRQSNEIRSKSHLLIYDDCGANEMYIISEK